MLKVLVGAAVLFTAITYAENAAAAELFQSDAQW